jgi:hypothetical protein
MGIVRWQRGERGGRGWGEGGGGEGYVNKTHQGQVCRVS